MSKYFDSADPKNWTEIDIPGILGVSFQPRNGNAVDLSGLRAVADASNRVLFTYLQSRYPNANRLVIDGLEPVGRRMSKGPPGILRASRTDFRISSGSAILVDPHGGKKLISLPQVTRLPQEDIPKENEESVLVLELEADAALGLDESVLAYESLHPNFRFVSKDEAKDRSLLPLALGIGGDYWYTDLERLWRPSHESIELLMTYFDTLEDVIWDSLRHGQPWKEQRVGMDWKLYQAKASCAVTAARITLAGRSSTTEDRIRTLQNLYWQLSRSVEDAAKEFSKLLGEGESGIVGQYASVFDPFPKTWDQRD
ncbi:MAG: hypothetical protein VX278_07095 [Myxococcota bacterium]|nr:hypothetical protein [Myxococcota bacterium]